MAGDAEASGRCAAECRSSTCSRLACVQAAAAARVADKDEMYFAAGRGDMAVVQDYLIADASYVDESPPEFWYDWTTLACLFYICDPDFLLAIVPPYISPPNVVTLKSRSCCCRATPPSTPEV
jgi:hypothetical protein